MTADMQSTRSTMLTVVAHLDANPDNRGSLQSSSVLRDTFNQLKLPKTVDAEQAVLTTFHDLMGSGILAWGINLSNPSPPFLHVTARGRKLLSNLSRDPGNPDGYMNYLQDKVKLSELARSYVEEALNCYVGGMHRGAAVLTGAAAEAMIIELRETILLAIKKHKLDPPRGLEAWQAKVVLEAISSFFDSSPKKLPAKVRERFSSYWPAYTQQIRATRNEAGHPSNLDPVTEEAVHAALLVFPEMATLQRDLIDWVRSEFALD